MEPIVVATQNPHKVEELGALLGADGALAFVGLADLAGPLPPEPDETGSTFLENATIKARTYARATGRVCLADDSGIEIDALEGRPGVISSHYATDGVETGLTRDQRDAANNARVLAELEGVKSDDRGARFVCVIVVAAPPSRLHPQGQVLASSRGTFEGRIGVPPRVPAGDNGFGYDPLLLVAPEHQRTSAELSPDEKNSLSHRANAARRLLPQLATLPDLAR